MYPHRIRLRGPWEMTAVGAEPRRVSFPATWADVGLPNYVGPVAFERRFGYPGRIDAHERVWLVGAGVAGPATLVFQGEPLGVVAAGTFAFEITPRLRERNLLKIALAVVAERVALWEDIALEVRATAYLEDIVCEGPIVRGRIAGTCPGPLEVYVLAAGQTRGYGKAHAGESFEIQCDPSTAPQRIELIDVATVWDVVEF